jgi:hypothetical protein
MCTRTKSIGAWVHDVHKVLVKKRRVSLHDGVRNRNEREFKSGVSFPCVSGARVTNRQSPEMQNSVLSWSTYHFISPEVEQVEQGLVVALAPNLGCELRVEEPTVDPLGPLNGCVLVRLHGPAKVLQVVQKDIVRHLRRRR